MKKILFLLTLSLARYGSYAQTSEAKIEIGGDSCRALVNSKIESQLLSTFGQQWLDDFYLTKQHIVLTVALDSFGNIIELINYRAESISKKDFDRFFDSLKRQSFCLFNTDPHISYEQYIASGQNRYYYVYPFPASH
jgi:hypothetical protein